MGQSVPIKFMDEAPGVPDGFWKHIENTLPTDEYFITTLFDDSLPDHADAGDTGIHSLLRSFCESDGVSDKDEAEARKWVEEFQDHFGPEINLIVE